jgi:hydrogenase maturation protein HypF
MSDRLIGKKILVRGIVQGVGFRPKVYGYAKTSKLGGWVCNSSRGVEIEVFGTENQIENFIHLLKSSPPPLAKIDSFEISEIEPKNDSEFVILSSQAEVGEFIPISPDISICPDCQKELFDPKDRRYHYPFINCTNCGPRFTIIRDIPYDRPNTTMEQFIMCPECKSEYENPADRRFHAQPTACPVCGPQVQLETISNILYTGEVAIQESRNLIKQGKILGIKGLGGYLLACDTGNLDAVQQLRSRKKRSDKPFALMAFDQSAVEEFCTVSEEEAEMLHSIQNPIVLLNKKTHNEISENIAPNQNSLGFMLPYTPLHLLLLQPEPGYPNALVMTSGNISEEPIAYLDEEAKNRLSKVADAFLTNNRSIHMRTDDSVVSVVNHQPYIHRRARGYAPNPIRLSNPVPPILAVGAELKNTFCLTRDQYAFISHHIGDLQNYETLQSFESGITHFENLFRIKPSLIACDLHPDYLSTQYAKSRACSKQIPIIEVQHHHAHLASCLADNGWTSDQPVIGICFDGTGYGTDGAIWGGEILVGGYKDYIRINHLAYMALPGGDAAIQKPYRITLAYLWQLGIDWDQDLPSVKIVDEKEKCILLHQLEHSINTVSTSSMGRLFDAVSSLLGICHFASYEGQAAIELEAMADPTENGFYEIPFSDDEIQIVELFKALIADLRNGIPNPIISARFHNSITQLVLDLCKKLKPKYDTNNVALSGGVWQNRFLLEKTMHALKSYKFFPIIHSQVPTNDGGISLGQAMVAAYSVKR